MNVIRYRYVRKIENLIRYVYSNVKITRLQRLTIIYTNKGDRSNSTRLADSSRNFRDSRYETNSHQNQK